MYTVISRSNDRIIDQDLCFLCKRIEIISLNCRNALSLLARPLPLYRPTVVKRKKKERRERNRKKVDPFDCSFTARARGRVPRGLLTHNRTRLRSNPDTRKRIAYVVCGTAPVLFVNHTRRTPIRVPRTCAPPYRSNTCLFIVF